MEAMWMRMQVHACRPPKKAFRNVFCHKSRGRFLSPISEFGTSHKSHGVLLPCWAYYGKLVEFALLLREHIMSRPRPHRHSSGSKPRRVPHDSHGAGGPSPALPDSLVWHSEPTS